MKTFSKISGGVCAPRQFIGSTAAAGIKNPDATRLDLALIVSKRSAVAAGTFTQNQVQAAPVKLSKKHLKQGKIQAIFANSGNANACTGEVGKKDAETTAKALSLALNIPEEEIALCSTGVIGLPLPMDRLLAPINSMCQDLNKNASTSIAQAIMTSDTQHKEIAVEFMADGIPVKIGVCAKGAGMICPNMATMLCFVTTDYAVSQPLLNQALQNAVEKSFNRITIDGDMSTNDTVLALANGAAGNSEPTEQCASYKIFQEALDFVLLEMAKALVRDGERVTKFVTVEVKGARTINDAKHAAEAVANSSLVKAAWNGEDPNWGRIIHAVGYSKASVRERNIDILMDGHLACHQGIQATTEMQLLRNVAQQSSFTVTVDLNLGKESYTVYASDLSPEYVDFNRSEYAYWKQARKDGLA